MKVHSLDVFIRDTMKEERRNHELTKDSILEKVQEKTRDAFGALSRVWTYLQEVTSSDYEDEDESIQVDLDLLLTHNQKTVLILAQALNTITYHRRFNVLSVLMTQTEAKSILKEKAVILGEKDYLLGKDFRNQVVKDTEAKAKMHNAVGRKKKGAKAQPQASTTPQIPFQESPSCQQGYRGSGGRRGTTNKFVYRKKVRQTQSQETGQCGNKPFSQQFGISCANTRFRFTKPTTIHKKSIPGNKNTSDRSSRKTKMLSKVLGKINQRPKHIGDYTRISDTLQKKTFPKIKKSEGDRNVQGSEDSGKSGNFRYVEKRGNKGVSTSPKSVCGHPVFSRQEGWGQLSSDKLKKIEQVDPLSTLQNGRFALSKVHVATR